MSGRQAHWIEKISKFDFKVEYVPGSENVMADALSRMYSNDARGTVRSKNEYTYFDVVNEDVVIEDDSLVPVLSGMEAKVAIVRRSKKKPEPAETGCPEMSQEFAARLKGHFVLKGPRQQTEGENRENTDSRIETDKYIPKKVSKYTNKEENIDQSMDPKGPMMEINPDLLTIISEAELGINIEKELQNNYQDDLLFKTIISRPADYKNFLIESGLIYLKAHGKNILCVPNIIIQGQST